MGPVGVALLLDPILTAILAWAIFSEQLDLYNLLAFPIVLLGVYLATDSQTLEE
ncbi:MAG: EamA family transporter [Hormoscilla sp. GUM202]|nr:EamA family transporter [Hormoscilla sp. GUM202]